ncbi:bile acid:sodium symporter family protein [Aeromicrobium sp. CTD01-1L150]|uniref:bile acid:sodium symporter family protein n=1 Tax=Aeromicrobium sp. CTD01-1L150 TaxID=3341830 RepID=UPI0035C03A03
MRLRPDPFIVLLMLAAVVATVLPATGTTFDALRVVMAVAIGLLFFLYGTRLSTAEALAGLRNWRLQVLLLLTTFAVFPVLGLAAGLLLASVLTPGLAAGVLLLCAVPSTIQGCVVYTRIASGNTAAAVVSASVSNLVGVFLTPALVAVLMSADARVDAASVLRIVLQLLAPFILGQLVRPLLGGWVTRHDPRLRVFDRSSIVLVIYVAFSEGATADVWAAVRLVDALVVSVVCVVLFVVVLAWILGVGRLAGFSRGDRVAMLFCGSSKSLASGLPMATVLFSSSDVALLVLPLMLYHQIQMIAGGVIAGRLGQASGGTS